MWLWTCLATANPACPVLSAGGYQELKPLPVWEQWSHYILPAGWHPAGAFSIQISALQSGTSVSYKTKEWRHYTSLSSSIRHVYYSWSPGVPCQHSAAVPLALIDVGAQAATCKLLLLQWTAASRASLRRAGQLFRGIIPTSVSCVFALSTDHTVPACEPQVQGTTEVPQCHIVALSPTTRLLQALFIQISCAVDSQSSSCKPRQQRGPSYCCLALRVRWETHVNTSALLTFKSIHWSQCARGGGKVTQRLVAVLAACPWEAEPLPSPVPVLAEHCVPLLLFLLPLILAIPCSTLTEQTGGGALLCVFFVVVIFLAFFSM